MVGAGLDKTLGVFARLTYHQMGIENKTAALAELGNHRRPNRNIRNKVAVHNIKMHHTNTSRGNHSYLVS
jgi:hypothetical protein